MCWPVYEKGTVQSQTLLRYVCEYLNSCVVLVINDRSLQLQLENGLLGVYTDRVALLVDEERREEPGSASEETALGILPLLLIV